VIHPPEIANVAGQLSRSGLDTPSIAAGVNSYAVSMDRVATSNAHDSLSSADSFLLVRDDLGATQAPTSIMRPASREASLRRPA
jgi:hypothetical protein